VNIAADPQHFLDWDKPLSEQHPVVQQALTPHVQNAIDKEYTTGSNPAKFTGGEAYSAASSVMPQFEAGGSGAPQLSAALQQAGIPGIKYLDAGSRNAANLTITPPSQTVSGKWMVKGDDYNAQGQHFDTEAQAKQYLDAQNAKATSNYVVFDPNMLSIVRKYAVPAFATAGGIPAAMGGSQPSQ
jgi:hypothetical protein